MTCYSLEMTTTRRQFTSTISEARRLCWYCDAFWMTASFAAPSISLLFIYHVRDYSHCDTIDFPRKELATLREPKSAGRESHDSPDMDVSQAVNFCSGYKPSIIPDVSLYLFSKRIYSCSFMRFLNPRLVIVDRQVIKLYMLRH